MHALFAWLQESGLLNRPEIPHLASLNRPLLVKAYDLGLIDARGRTETRVIAEMLAAAESMVGGRLEREALAVRRWSADAGASAGQDFGQYPMP